MESSMEYPENVIIAPKYEEEVPLDPEAVFASQIQSAFSNIDQQQETTHSQDLASCIITISQAGELSIPDTSDTVIPSVVIEMAEDASNIDDDDDDNDDDDEVLCVSSDSEPASGPVTYRVNEDGALVPVQDCPEPPLVISSDNSDAEEGSGSDIEIINIQPPGSRKKTSPVVPKLSKRSLGSSVVPKALKRKRKMMHQKAKTFIPSKKVLEAMKQDVSGAKLLRISGTCSTLVSDFNVQRFSDVLYANSKMNSDNHSQKSAIKCNMQLYFDYLSFNSIDGSNVATSCGSLEFSHEDEQRSAALEAQPLAFNPRQELLCFYHKEVVQKRRLDQSKLLCNFCQWVNVPGLDFRDHIRHHLFVCRLCQFTCTTRLELEVHKSMEKHDDITTEREGYILHKSGHTSSLKIDSTETQTYLTWIPVQEVGKVMIVSDALKDKNKHSSDVKPLSCLPFEESIVVALLFYRHMPDREIRKFVIEFHCNRCQFTSQSKRETIRHIDFHMFDCDHEDCHFKCFTRLEFLVHKRQRHENSAHSLQNLMALKVDTKCSEDVDDQHLIDWDVKINFPIFNEIGIK